MRRTGRLRELQRLLRQYRGDRVAAVLALAGDPTQVALADRLGLPRSTIEQALRGHGGRDYRSVLRSIEAELGLPQYTLEEDAQ